MMNNLSKFVRMIDGLSNGMIKYEDTEGEFFGKFVVRKKHLISLIKDIVGEEGSAASFFAPHPNRGAPFYTVFLENTDDKDVLYVVAKLKWKDKWWGKPKINARFELIIEGARVRRKANYERIKKEARTMPDIDEQKCSRCNYTIIWNYYETE